jgi:hypothetical protein
MTKFIGLGHYSRTGKDTLANFIVSDLRKAGFSAKKISLAWKLKQIAYELYSWAGMREPEFYDTEEGAPYRDRQLAFGMTPVQIWVALGTPGVRENVYDRTWIDYVLKTDHPYDVVVVPDIRFPNEIAAFRDEGAILAKVTRPGVEPRNTVADLALTYYEDWDTIVYNDGSLSDLQDWSGYFVGRINNDRAIQKQC